MTNESIYDRSLIWFDSIYRFESVNDYFVPCEELGGEYLQYEGYTCLDTQAMNDDGRVL